MTAPSGYTVRYDIKGEPRKFRNGSQQLQDFNHRLRQEAVLLAEEDGSGRWQKRSVVALDRFGIGPRDGRKAASPPYWIRVVDRKRPTTWNETRWKRS